MAENISGKEDNYDALLDEEEENSSDDDGERTRQAALAGDGLDVNDLLHNHKAEIELQPPPASNDDPEQECGSSFRRELSNIFNAISGGGGKILGSGDKALPNIRDNFEEYKTHMEDITPERDGGVFKRVIQPGTGASAGKGNIVKFHYSLQIEDQDEPFDSSVARGKLKKAKLGEESLISGLEMALLTMKEGELADFIIDHKYAFSIGCPPFIPANCTIRATVRVVELRDEDPVDAMSKEERRNLPPAEAMQYIIRKLDEGKVEFGRGKIVTAINRYKLARLQGKLVTSSWSETDMEGLKAHLIRVHKNLAVCYTKLGRWKKVKYYLEKLDQAAVSDAKVRFLWAKVYHNEGEYDKALLELASARACEPKNAEIAKFLVRVQEDKAKYQLKSSEQIKRMFSEKLAKGDNASTDRLL